MRVIYKIFLFSVLGFISMSTVLAEKPSDTDALKNIEVGKVVWDVLVGRPDSLLYYLKLIDETYDDLVRQNVEPDMVFIFHGRAIQLIKSEEVDYLPKDKQAHKEALALISDLNARPGVRMEACSISATRQGIENDGIISDVKMVGNTYVSLIGYQSKGYSVIPVH